VNNKLTFIFIAMNTAYCCIDITGNIFYVWFDVFL